MANDEGQGFLYPKKNRSGNQPHLTGEGVINGRTVEIAAWKKTAKSGVPYLSLKLQDKGEELQDEENAEPVAPSLEGDDDIPF